MNRVLAGLLLVGFLLGGFLLPSVPALAMTGTGTESNPFIISSVDDLQDMNLDYSAYYELGRDIDASVTSSWNGGVGFDPVGEPGNSITRRPTSDYSATGIWTIYPSGTTRWDKVDEATPDDGSTYIDARQDGCRALFSFSSIDLPVDAIHISVIVYARMTNVSTHQVKPSLRVGGGTYDVGNGFKVFGPGWVTHGVVIGTNPKTGLDWTINDIEGVGVNTLDAFGVYFSWDPGKVTQVYISVHYGLAFLGSFDGNGYTIDSLFINRPTEDYVGLFGYTEAATIQDVKLSNADITGDDYVGAFVGDGIESTVQDIELTNIDVTGDGEVGGLAGEFVDGEVSNCSSTGTVGSSGIDVGGLIGLSVDVDLSHCSSTGDVTSVSRYIGGLIGYSYCDTITRCYATGDVTGDQAAGGLIGYADGSTITECYATGDATVDSYYAGGLIGDASYNNTITECYATGDATGGAWGNGGLVGLASSSTDIADCYARGNASADDGVGGLVGDTSGGVTNCYSTGLVVGTGSDVGGFVGMNNGTVTNCFWDTETSGMSTSNGGTGLTTTQMKTKTTYLDAGWDFASIWKMGGAAPGGWAAFWLTSIVFLMFAGIMFGATKNPGLSILMAFPLVVVAAWLGVGTTMLQVVLIIVLAVAVIFGIYFILGRFA